MFITVGLELVIQQQKLLLVRILPVIQSSKDVKGDGTTGVQTFTSIQGAIDELPQKQD